MPHAELVMRVADTVLVHFMDWFEALVPLIIIGSEG